MKTLTIINKNSSFQFGIVNGKKNLVVHFPFFSVNIKKPSEGDANQIPTMKTLTNKLKRFGLVDLLLMSPALTATVWAVLTRLGATFTHVITIFVR